MRDAFSRSALCLSLAGCVLGGGSPAPDVPVPASWSIAPGDLRDRNPSVVLARLPQRRAPWSARSSTTPTSRFSQGVLQLHRALGEA